MNRALVLALVVACPAPHGGPVVHDDAVVPWEKAHVDWSTPPPIAPRPRFMAPHVADFVLHNGIDVKVISRPGLPIVTITALHLRAGAREDGAQVGLAALTADLLDEGAGSRDRAAFAVELERIGMRLDIDIATDHAAMRGTVLSSQLAAAVGLIADAIRHPHFEPVEVARVRDTRIADLRAQRERPRTIAAHVFDRVVFGAHPYAQPADGTASSLETLSAGDVATFHAHAYTPSSTAFVVVGDVERDDVFKVFDHAFGDWSAPVPTTNARILPAFTPVLAYVDMPGATTSAVMIGRSEDREIDVADEVANAILGSAANGRLDRKLRGELRVAGAAGSNLWSGKWGGTWSIALNANTDSTAAAIRAALALVVDQRKNLVTTAELAATKLELEHELARTFETATSAAHAIERWFVRAQLDYAKRDDAIAAVTPEDVREVAARTWQSPAIVVVGDWAKLRDDLTKLGLPIVHYDADGHVLP